MGIIRAIGITPVAFSIILTRNEHDKGGKSVRVAVKHAMGCSGDDRTVIRAIHQCARAKIVVVACLMSQKEGEHRVLGKQASMDSHMNPLTKFKHDSSNCLVQVLISFRIVPGAVVTKKSAMSEYDLSLQSI